MRPHDVAGRRAVAASYAPLPFLSRVFVRLRLAILPLEEVEREVPSGTIADIGCGYGILSQYLAHADPRRAVTGIERDSRIVSRAWQAVPRGRVRFVYGDAETMPLESCDGIVLCDVLHHLSPRGQEHILRAAAQALAPGGRVVLKDIEGERSIWYCWNLFHDRVLRLSGATHHRGASEWAAMLAGLGLTVVTVRHFNHLLYHHIIVIAERSPA